jgi:hypothetical protein
MNRHLSRNGEADYLHVWGFHEAKLDSESIKRKIVKDLRELSYKISL